MAHSKQISCTYNEIKDTFADRAEKLKHLRWLFLAGCFTFNLAMVFGVALVIMLTLSNPIAVAIGLTIALIAIVGAAIFETFLWFSIKDKQEQNATSKDTFEQNCCNNYDNNLTFFITKKDDEKREITREIKNKSVEDNQNPYTGLFEGKEAARKFVNACSKGATFSF